MNQIAHEIAETFLEIMRLLFINDFSNIQQVKLSWHHLNYISFSIINYSRIYKSNLNSHTSFNPILINMNKLGLLAENSLLFWTENKELINPYLEKIIVEYTDSINQMDLSLLREYFLGFNLSISRDKIHLNIEKNGKDIIGAYYTPKNLARAVVNEAFGKFEQEYFERHGGNSIINYSRSVNSQDKFMYQEICIADLSCGGGEFIRASQKYLLEKHRIQLTESCTYFWGIDVDPIALQITICDLLANANRNDWQIIISHFILGNPLVDTKEESSFTEKSDLFGLGRIYAKGIGLNYNSSFAEKRFDIVIGNPPWEKIRFEERKYFARLRPEISAIPQKDKRREAISNLQIEWPALFQLAMQVFGDYKELSNGSFQHPKIKFAVVGELNTYALFTELGFEVTKPAGVCSLIVKSALVTSPVNKRLWNILNKDGFVQSVCLFDNKRKIFNIDSREKFCAITLSHRVSNEFGFIAGLSTAEEMNGRTRSKVSYHDLAIVNPLTGMLPNVSNTADMQFLLDLHKELPPFETVYPDCHFGRLIHLTAHAEYIDTESNNDNLPIFEGKFIEQYDARFSSFASLDNMRKYAAKAFAVKTMEDGKLKSFPTSRYFVQKSLWEKYSTQYPEQYSLCWRSLTSSTNARTTLAMILPTCPTCQSIQMLQIKDERSLLLLLGLFNSIPFDYFVRLKMPGIDLTQSVIKQIPVPPKEAYCRNISFEGRHATLELHIFSHLYFLLREESLVQKLLSNINYPIYMIEPASNGKSIVRKKLDYLYSQAYGISKDTFNEILATFPKY